jgi:hypothetical protein
MSADLKANETPDWAALNAVQDGSVHETASKSATSGATETISSGVEPVASAENIPGSSSDGAATVEQTTTEGSKGRTQKPNKRGGRRGRKPSADGAASDEPTATSAPKKGNRGNGNSGKGPSGPAKKYTVPGQLITLWAIVNWLCKKIGDITPNQQKEFVKIGQKLSKLGGAVSNPVDTRVAELEAENAKLRAQITEAKAQLVGAEAVVREFEEENGRLNTLLRAFESCTDLTHDDLVNMADGDDMDADASADASVDGGDDNGDNVDASARVEPKPSVPVAAVSSVPVTKAKQSACHFGFGCGNAGCGRSHPACRDQVKAAVARKHGIKLCRFGPSCRSKGKKCQLVHEYGTKLEG